MKFLEDKKLYSDTDYCLDHLQKVRYAPGVSDKKMIFHTYWYGEISAKQLLSIKSFLTTQDLTKYSLWLWLDIEGGYKTYTKNKFLKPVIPFIKVMPYDPEHLIRNTPLKHRSDLVNTKRLLSARANYFRLLVLYKYGGAYFDLDMLFLRNMSGLINSYPDDFCYQFSNFQYANNAFLKIRQESPALLQLFEIVDKWNSGHSWHIFLFKHKQIDLLVLPCVFFDPLWLHNDGVDKATQVPFDSFSDFFEPVKRTNEKPFEETLINNFFPGAFAYHWHNNWFNRDYPNSYAGLFDNDCNEKLKNKYNIRITTNFKHTYHFKMMNLKLKHALYELKKSVGRILQRNLFFRKFV